MDIQQIKRQDDLVAAHQRLNRRIPERRGESGGSARPVDAERRARSLRTCHRYAAIELPPVQTRPGDRGYVPELAAGLEDDPYLTDGARRCARKIAELTYRQSRGSRALPVTVSFLSRGLGRCRRTVQRYLRLLEQRGYIRAEIVAAERSRMCAGLIVHLLGPLLAPHHRQKWPGKLGNPDATPKSQNQRFNNISSARVSRWSVDRWALRCMEGVFRSLMKTNPLAGLPTLVAAP